MDFNVASRTFVFELQGNFLWLHIMVSSKLSFERFIIPWGRNIASTLLTRSRLASS